MEKTDYKKKLKHLYKPSTKKVDIVEVPKMNFLWLGLNLSRKARQHKQCISARSRRRGPLLKRYICSSKKMEVSGSANIMKYI